MSVEVQIDLEGAEEFSQALSKFDSGMQTQVQTSITEWAETVKTEATRLVPVRTGYLRSTIFTRTQQWQAEVGAEAVYAASIEFGTHCAQAKPFIQPALQKHLPELERILLNTLGSAKTEAGL